MEAETGHFGVKMNSMPKHVATTTLTEPEWNATLHRRATSPRRSRELKAGPGNVLINGSASLINYLTRHNLIDEYRIMIYPGGGRRGPQAVGRGHQGRLEP